jgi:hypothetical protein
MTTHKTPTPREAAAQRKLHANAERAKNGQGQTTGANPVEALNNFEAKNNLQPTLKAVLFAENLADIQAATPKARVEDKISAPNILHNQSKYDLVLPIIVCLGFFIFIKKMYSLNKNNIIENNAASASMAASLTHSRRAIEAATSPEEEALVAVAGLFATPAATSPTPRDRSPAATPPVLSRRASEEATSPTPRDRSPAATSPTPRDRSPAATSPTPRDRSPAATPPVLSRRASEAATSPTPRDISPEATSPARHGSPATARRDGSQAGTAQQRRIQRSMQGQNSPARNH